MKNLNLTIAAIVLSVSSSAFAVSSDKYKDMNLVMSCGDIDIVNTEYTTRLNGLYKQGQLTNKNFDLGSSVWLVQGNQTYSMSKTANPVRQGLFRTKKGFGLFETPEYKLDLRNTVDNYEIYLENKTTGEKTQCKVLGDCC